MDDVSDCCDTPVRNVSGKDIINKKIKVSKNLSDKSEPLKNEFNKTILIAEDNESNYILLKCMLRKNYNLIRATNGIEAINIFNSQKPDIILMDIRMPLMNGLDATLKIRETNKNIPIIALTAHAFDEDKRLAFDAGCNDFLTKPVNLNNLNKLLNSYN